MKPWGWCTLLVAAWGCRAPSGDGAGERSQLVAELEQLRAEKAAQQAERMEARLGQTVQAAVDAGVARALGKELAALRSEVGALQEAATRDARALDAKVAALARDLAQAQAAAAGAQASGRDEAERRSVAQLAELRREAAERAAGQERALVDMGVKLDQVRAAQEQAAAERHVAPAVGTESRPARDPVLEELRAASQGVREALVEQGRRQATIEASLRELQALAGRPAEGAREVSEKLQEFGRSLERLAEQVRAQQEAPRAAPPAVREPRDEAPAGSRPAESRPERRLTLPEPPPAPTDARPRDPQGAEDRSRRVARSDAGGFALPRAQSAPAASGPGPVLLGGRPAGTEPAPPGVRALSDAWATLRDPLVALPALVVIASCLVALFRRRPGSVRVGSSAAAQRGEAPAAAPSPGVLSAAVPSAAVLPAAVLSAGAPSQGLPAAATPARTARPAAPVAALAEVAAAAGSPPPPRLVLVRLEGVADGASRREQLERALAVARGDTRVLAEPEPKAEVRSDGSAALRCYVAGFLPAEDEAELRRRLTDALLLRTA